MRITPRSIFIIIILLVLCLGLVYLLNKPTLDKALLPHRVITPESKGDIGAINFGDVVEVTGTPDLLNAVSLEDRNGGEVYDYFVPLKEYGTTFVVKMKRGKLRTELQTFVGTTTGLNQTEHENRIRNRLNRPIELDDQDRADLDADTIEILTEQTTKEFTSKTILILDNEMPDANEVYAVIAFWGSLLFIAITTISRRYIFR